MRALAAAGWALAFAGVAHATVTQSLSPVQAVLAVFVLTLPTVGALLATKRPTHPLGWMLLTASVAAFGLTALGDVGERLARRGSGGIVADTLVWVSGLSFVGVVLLAVHVPLRFPDGDLPSPAWRRVERLAHAGTALFAFGLLLAPGPLAERDVANPLGFAALSGVTALASGVGFLALGVSAVAAIASLVARGRRGGPEVRQQLRWLVFAVALVVGSVGLLWVNPVLGLSEDAAVLVFGTTSLVVLPGAIGVAVLRHKALDIDLIIRRSLVYGVLWLAIAAVYVGVAVALGVAAGSRLPVGVAVLLTVLATVAFSPARHWLERVADTWVFGPRSSAPQMLAGLGSALADTSEPEEIARSLAHTVSTGLRLTWAEVRLDGRQPVMVGTNDAAEALAVPVVHAGTTFGTVRCGQRADPAKLTDADVELVSALAAHAGLALHSSAIAARLVVAHETERRRIERNIHDGAQQQLVALMARLGVARRRFAGSDVEPTLLDLQHELRVIMEDLRALAQGIHPSVLTDGGLVEAVAQRCDRLPIAVGLHVDAGLAGLRLSDQIEGAGYFVVSEALANVLKHARASRVTVRLACEDGQIGIDVVDDGVGFDPGDHAGGLGALADRLSALGGSLEVHSKRGSGTQVRAVLPLKAAGTDDA